MAGFLAGYSGLTRDAYALDLRQFASWCQGQGLHLFQARRANIECFGRDMEARGRARATIARRLCTVSGFYRYAVEEELLEHSPAVHVRRPRLDYESHAIGLDRNEVGSLLVAAKLGAANEHALISGASSILTENCPVGMHRQGPRWPTGSPRRASIHSSSLALWRPQPLEASAAVLDSKAMPFSTSAGQVSQQRSQRQ